MYDPMRMPIKSVAPGLVFVHNGYAYLKTTELPNTCGCTAVNISTGELRCFDPDFTANLTEFGYYYDA